MPAIDIKHKVVFITGANRGIGKALAIKALEMGAQRVYACSRVLGKLEAMATDERLTPVELDVTNAEQIAVAAELAKDTEILINNAGVAGMGSFITRPNPEGAQQEMAVNYFGAANMARAFAPILKANGGGALVNIASIAGMCNFPLFGSYSASKAAAHSLTQGLRAELASQDTLVAGVYPGPIDTDMAAALPFDKASPDATAQHIFDALAKGEEDIFPDPFSQQMAAALKADAKAVEQQQIKSFNQG